MTKYNKQYIVVKSQYVPHTLQYIAIPFWHIVTALNNMDPDQTATIWIHSIHFHGKSVLECV